MIRSMMWGLVLAIVVMALLHGPAGTVLAVVAGVLAGLAGWWLDVRLHPYGPCWWCRGDPKVRDSSGRNWRPCRVCGGSGRRRRTFAGREP